MIRAETDCRLAVSGFARAGRAGNGIRLSKHGGALRSGIGRPPAALTELPAVGALREGLMVMLALALAVEIALCTAALVRTPAEGDAVPADLFSAGGLGLLILLVLISTETRKIGVGARLTADPIRESVPRLTSTPVALAATLADLHDHRIRLERQSQRLVEIADRTMREKAEAEREAEARAELLARIGHDLRTPLNAIIGFSHLMMAEVHGPLGNARYQDYAKHVQESGNRLLAVADEILAMTRDLAPPASHAAFPEPTLPRMAADIAPARRRAEPEPELAMAG